MEMQIRIENLEKYYGRRKALDHVNLTISQGMFGLLGRNGAGKTTLMKILAALQKKQGGKVEVCGVPVENRRKIRQMTGYLPQDFSMYPNMTVYEAMDYLGVLSGLKKEVRQELPDQDPPVRQVREPYKGPGRCFLRFPRTVREEHRSRWKP